METSRSNSNDYCRMNAARTTVHGCIGEVRTIEYELSEKFLHPQGVRESEAEHVNLFGGISSEATERAQPNPARNRNTQFVAHTSQVIKEYNMGVNPTSVEEIECRILHRQSTSTSCNSSSPRGSRVLPSTEICSGFRSSLRQISHLLSHWSF